MPGEVGNRFRREHSITGSAPEAHQELRDGWPEQSRNRIFSVAGRRRPLNTIFSLDGEAFESAEQEWQRSATVREDPSNIRKFCGGAAKHHAGDRARRVGGVLNGGYGNARDEACAAFGLRGMYVNNRLPAIEFFVYRLKGFVAEVFVVKARHQTNAVGLQCVHGIFNLAETALRIGKRNGGKQTESPSMIGDHLCSVVVALARQPSGIFHAA